MQPELPHGPDQHSAPQPGRPRSEPDKGDEYRDPEIIGSDSATPDLASAFLPPPPDPANAGGHLHTSRSHPSLERLSPHGRALIECGSWADLRALYTGKGCMYRSPKELRAAVAADWMEERTRLLEGTLTQKSAGEPYTIQLAVGGNSYTLLGVVHSHKIAFDGGSIDPSGEPYLRSILSQLTAFPGWVLEQNLDQLFLPVPLPTLSDHGAEGETRRLFDDMRKIFSRPFSFALQTLRQLRHQAATGASPVPTRALIRGMTHFIPDALSDVPLHIDVMYREESGLPLTRTQRRSAYQAAFLAAWRPEDTFRISAGEKALSTLNPELLTHKGIVVGATHAPEIEYFLKQGVKDAGVRARAERAAERLNEGIDRYLAFQNRQEMVHFLLTVAGSSGVGAGIGTAIGKIISLLH